MASRLPPCIVSNQSRTTPSLHCSASRHCLQVTIIKNYSLIKGIRRHSLGCAKSANVVDIDADPGDPTPLANFSRAAGDVGDHRESYRLAARPAQRDYQTLSDHGKERCEPIMVLFSVRLWTSHLLPVRKRTYQGYKSAVAHTRRSQSSNIFLRRIGTIHPFHS
jgi:hypothetical protein